MASVAGAASTSPSAAVLVVSTTSDAPRVINGDVSSPAALIAHPGPGGISLREAITAVNNARGRYAITFAPSLAGKTIVVMRPMPAITRDGTALIGLTSASGEPVVTLDGMRAGPTTLAVVASNVSITHLRFVDVRGVGHTALNVTAGGLKGELNIHGDRVEWNVFDNSGASGAALRLGTADNSPNLTGAVFSDVTVAHNVIEHLSAGDGLLLGLNGTHSTAERLLIEDNTFTDIASPGSDGQGYAALEYSTGPSDDQIVGTQILRNTFTGGLGVNLNVGTSGDGLPNVISGTLISQNVFNDAEIVFGGSSGTGNSILDTEIINDLLMRDVSLGGAIVVAGGDKGGTGNRVDGVSLINDTLAFNKTALTLINNGGGSTGNQLSNVQVENSIFWSNGSDLGSGGPGASTVAPTISSSLMGIDPRFVGAQDFHVSAGSPAINAGSRNGAPAVDIEDRTRDSNPDIGAYEFGAALRPRLNVALVELGGTGTVTSSPTGITCGMTCDVAFDAHTAVTLTAVPAPGSRFAGWSGGGCSGTGACKVILNTAAMVSATFSAAAPNLAPICKSGQKSTSKHPCRHS